MKFITNRITCRMSIISSIMIRAFMISISSSQIRLLFRTLAATIHTADRTGLLSAEKCRRHLSAGTDSGRAGLFYHIATSCSGPADESFVVMLLHRKNSLKEFMFKCSGQMHSEQKINP